jgi:hypothetical protein
MPEFAAGLAEAAVSADPGATLATLLADPMQPACKADRQKVQSWLSRQPASTPPVPDFGSADAAMLIKRWNIIRRLRFAEGAGHEPPPPAP